ncbi:hypothetical protein [Novosphingobium beihaiensis]|uniref:Uncharacterized protein n=1 Tax=Novosphingobium beihaiensis TaxID=2930389 RepID=A0ABT0BN80_9SPHN|nr:hypothetical protein [Novosphingobium beihaiensis]MCJ2186505.1 hypothetical protein [Novosphingobium beihaiensis]
MAVSVHRLVHRGAARDTVRDRIALEDAFQTALPQDGRLVLIRKLTVRGQVASPHHRQEAVRRGWIEAVAGSVHAASTFAQQANCVWFASRAEAEAILLRKLLSGESVEGWFWALAVPGWHGYALDDWLSRRIALYLREQDHSALARAAQTCIEAGRSGAFVAAADHALRPQVTASAFSEAPSHSHTGSADPASEDLTCESAAAVQRIAGRLQHTVLTPAWIDVLHRLEYADLPSAAYRELSLALLQERIRRASPALVLAPQRLCQVAQRLAEIAAGRLVPASPRPDTDAHPGIPAAGIMPEQASPHTAPHDRQLPGRSETAPPPVPATSREAQSSHAMPPETAEPAPVLAERMESGHAGLWLIVPSLIRLGFRSWLSTHPGLLGDDPGRRLVQAIARHHRVLPADPALAVLVMAPEEDEPPVWIGWWRTGLDRWLRRTARRRTHDLIARPGRVFVGEDRLDIRFSRDAADIRLRRLALDSDPGWTDWLGLSLHFHFGGGEAP